MRRAEVVAIALALSGHALALLVAGVGARSPGRLVARAPFSETPLVEIEVSSFPSLEHGSGAPEPGGPARDALVSPARAAVGLSRREGPSQLPAPPPENTQPATPSPGQPEYDAPSAVPVVGLVPGIGAPIWSMPGVLPTMPSRAPAAPTRAPTAPDLRNDQPANAIKGTLDTRDHALGLDQPAARTVAIAIETAIRSSEAPPDSRATFEVKIGPGGSLLSVRALRSNAGSAGTWDRIAKAAAAGLAKKALAMRGDAVTRGATVTVSVESKARLPSGAKEAPRVEPMCAEEQLVATARQLGELLPGDNPFGSAEEADGTKKKRHFCIPIGVSAVGDLSDIGAHKTVSLSSTVKIRVPGIPNLPEQVRPVDARAPWAEPGAEGEPRPKPKKPKPQAD